MEVHQHTHTPRKKWTHYFWEFLMLFLAVTLGFFMENQREHFIEKRRAKFMAKSLCSDLKNDTFQLGELTEQRKLKILVLDSLMNELDKPLLRQNDTLLARRCRRAIYTRRYFVSESGTYEQIKNSGSLRYYKMGLQKALVNYEAQTKGLDIAQDLENKFVMEQIAPFLMNVENPRFFRAMFNNRPTTGLTAFRESNSGFRDELYNYALFIRGRSQNLVNIMDSVKLKATLLITLLQKEYDLK